MSLEIVFIYATVVFLVIGSIFTSVAAIGLLKLNDPMTRLHAPTKAATVGIGSFLLASVMYSLSKGEGSFHEIMILAFLFVTAPISANFIAKVNIHKKACIDPPKPEHDEMWSTMDVPETDLETAPETRG
jgi:multicomponent K+:H+ antiporter subunit G